MKSFIKIFILCLLHLKAFCNIENDMDNFFKSAGFQSNVTGAGAYKGQSAGLYTGGHIYARNRVRNMQIANMQLPSYSAGCGGIDLFAGSFSFINSNEFVNTLENIGNSAASFGFLLGLETMSPQIEGVMTKLNDLAQRVNQFNINSCETASSLVGGLWPKHDVAERYVCASGGANGIFSDWAQARQGCGYNKGRANTLQKLKGSQYDELIADNVNIAWKALQKNANVSQNKALAELLMSLSGSIVIKGAGSDGERMEYKVLPSLASDHSLIKALMYGDQAKIYQCDTSDKCLNPTETIVSIPEHSSFLYLVRGTLEDLRDAIATDRPLSAEQKYFLGSTSIPIYKILNVEYAYSSGGDILNLDSYAAVIASDILYQYLNESLTLVRDSASALHLTEDLMNNFRESIQLARNEINKERNRAHADMSVAIDLINRTQFLEQQLAGHLSSHLINAIGWDNGN